MNCYIPFPLEPPQIPEIPPPEVELTPAEEARNNFIEMMETVGNGVDTADANAKGWADEYFAFAKRAYAICGQPVDFIDWTRTISGLNGGMTWFGNPVPLSAMYVVEGVGLSGSIGGYANFQLFPPNPITDYTLMRCRKCDVAASPNYQTFGFPYNVANFFAIGDGVGGYFSTTAGGNKVAGGATIQYGRFPCDESPFMQSMSIVGGVVFNTLMCGFATTEVTTPLIADNNSLWVSNQNNSTEFFNLWVPVGLTNAQLYDLQDAYRETLGRNIVGREIVGDSGDYAEIGGTLFGAGGNGAMVPCYSQNLKRLNADEVVAGNYSQGGGGIVVRDSGSRDFVVGDIGKWILWGTGPMARITVINSVSAVVVDRTQTVPSGAISIIEPAFMNEVVFPKAGHYDVEIRGRPVGDGITLSTMSIGLMRASDLTQQAFGSLMLSVSSAEMSFIGQGRIIVSAANANELRYILGAGIMDSPPTMGYIQLTRITFKKAF